MTQDISQRAVTIELAFPVEVAGVTYSTLTLRRMRAKDALLAEGLENSAEAGFRLYAALAGVDRAVIAELDMDDLQTLVERSVPLMGKRAAALQAALTDPQTASAGAT
jgi:hypothetical protein